MRRLITSQRGFSLIETMMAFGILAVGMMAVASMITASLQFDRKSISRRDGFNVAMEKFEELKKDYILAVYPATVDPPDPETNRTIAENVAGGFRRKTEFVVYPGGQRCVRCVSGIGAGVRGYVYEVKITVGWGDSASCTAATPDQCPSKTVFTNYIILQRTDHPTCITMTACP